MKKGSTVRPYLPDSLKRLEPLVTLVSHCSFNALVQQSQCTQLASDSPQDMKNLIPRMSQVTYLLLASDAIHITLKVFYTPDCAAKMVASRFKTEPGIVKPELSADFMKELCNIAAGFIHRKLQPDLLLWVSLPYLRAATDDPIVKHKDSGKPTAHWRVTTPFGELFYFAEIFVLDWDIISEIDFGALETRQEEEVSFL